MERLKRVFAAVRLPDEVRLALADRLSSLSVPGRAAPPDNWHLTLRFLGIVDEPTLDRFVAALDMSDLGDPFRLVLEGLGAFPRPGNATVLWVGIGGDLESLADLSAVVEECAVGAGLDGEERPFSPHLTLSRIRPPEDVSELISDAPEFGLGWECQELIVYRSHLGGGPARYEPLETITLGR